MSSFITRYNWESGAAFGFLLLCFTSIVVWVGLKGLTGQTLSSTVEQELSHGTDHARFSTRFPSLDLSRVCPCISGLPCGTVDGSKYFCLLTILCFLHCRGKGSLGIGSSTIQRPQLGMFHDRRLLRGLVLFIYHCIDCVDIVCDNRHVQRVSF